MPIPSDVGVILKYLLSHMQICQTWHWKEEPRALSQIFSESRERSQVAHLWQKEVLSTHLLQAPVMIRDWLWSGGSTNQSTVGNTPLFRGLIRLLFLVITAKRNLNLKTCCGGKLKMVMSDWRKESQLMISTDFLSALLKFLHFNQKY